VRPRHTPLCGQCMPTRAEVCTMAHERKVCWLCGKVGPWQCLIRVYPVPKDDAITLGC
jgi:hypothetical protein